MDADIECFSYYGYSKHPLTDCKGELCYHGSFIGKSFHMIASKITGLTGYYSWIDTLRIINILKQKKIDIVHLHNIHGWFLNLPYFFRFIKKRNIAIVWTFHDCWNYTGHCPHYSFVKCDKWKSRCQNCPLFKEYPSTLFDNSSFLFSKKKKWFLGFKNIRIVTPSIWLKKEVEQSFLKQYPITVINNGINLDIFKPIYGNFKEKYAIKNRYVILGVSFSWGEKKGFDVFIELSKIISSDFVIVLVGVSQSQINSLPNNIIGIQRTTSQKELAEIYTAADVFVNPTRQEVLGLVNIESLACGTPVITFDSGGSPETITEKTGTVVNCNDINGLFFEIKRICITKPFKTEDCIERAKKFDMEERFNDYIKLFKELEETKND